MKPLLLILALLVSPAMALAATIYVDPSCANNGDGTAGSPCAASGGAAGPYNTWVGMSFSAGNTYAGQGGQSETLSSYQIGASGSAGNPITITSYGTGQFTFNATASYATAIVSRTYITWDNVKFKSTNSACLYISLVSNNIIVTNNTFDTCGQSNGTTGAIYLDPGATRNFDDITITDNSMVNVVGRCFHIDEIPSTNSLNYNNITFSRNDCTNASSGTGSNVSAVDIKIAATSTASITNLTIEDNIFDNVNDEEASPAHVIRVTRNPDGAAHEDLFGGVRINRNFIRNAGGGIYVNHLFSGGSQSNQINHNTLASLVTTAGIITFWSEDFDVAYNDIDGILSFASVSYLDGSGIDTDLGSVNFRVYGNVVKNCVGDASQPDLSGAGIEEFGTEHGYFYGNVLVGNKHGFTIGSQSGGIPGIVYFQNNTIANSTRDGIYIRLDQGYTHEVRNNIVYGSGRYGINNEYAGDVTLTKNIFYGNVSGDYASQGAGASDILEDPLFMSSTDFRTRGTSPARRAGQSGSICLDVRGRACYPDTPDIGAYQATSGDPASTRTAR